MDELYQIFRGLNNLLEKKRYEIEQSGRKMDSYLISEFANRENEIDAFAKSIAQVNVSGFEINSVVENFKRDAEIIKQNIAAIGENK